MRLLILMVLFCTSFWLSAQNLELPSDSIQKASVQTDSLLSHILQSDSLQSDTLRIFTDFRPLIPIDSLINYSRKFIGTPYRYGGKTEKGFDCSGFVYHVYKQFGIELPPSSRTQVEIGSPVAIDSVRKGDLLFFKGRNIKSSQIGHVAIVIDVSDTNDVQIIHSTRHGLKAEWLSQEEYFKKRYVTSRRLEFDDLKN
ncbi:MAG: C40 family peptidase [Bacteroidetes bacterium]|jgi:cell wall-associated NlpC family hydrolase|nr:C40 family peptidase [Bacteroidota bacterium]